MLYPASSDIFFITYGSGFAFRLREYMKNGGLCQ